MLYVGAKLYGLLGLVIANTLYTLIAYAFFSGLSSFYLKENIWGQYKRLLSSLLCVIPPSIIVLVLNRYLLSDLSGFLTILIDSLFFTSIYWLFSIKTKNEGCLYLNSAFSKLIGHVLLHNKMKK